jgi:hypothetical protein
MLDFFYQEEYPDYTRYVNTPMDLTTVREYLNTGEYECPEDFKKDVVLIFKNSRSYNTNPKAKVLVLTNKLEAWFGKEISAVLHDWKRTMRRLSQGRSSRSEKRPKLKGKGKGTGKGQSNRINKARKRSEDDSAESESESDDASDSEFSGAEKMPPTRASSRLPSPSAGRPPARSEPADFDPHNPQPCSSRSALRSQQQQPDHTEESRYRFYETSFPPKKFSDQFSFSNC